METINTVPENYVTAIKLIDEAHAQDPRSIEGKNGPLPFELDYAQKMTRWLALRCPEASPVLQLACRAQHFRRFVLTFRHVFQSLSLVFDAIAINIQTCTCRLSGGRFLAAATP